MSKYPSYVDGHLVDIDDKTDRLRIRPHQRMTWNQKGQIDSIERLPSTSSSQEDLPLIFPGFIDCHIHFPQTHIIGGYGIDLLDWLTRNVWPEECKFADEDYAREAARVFLRRMWSSGTTTALVFGSQFLQANEVLFAKAHEHQMCLLSGPTLQDRFTHTQLEFPPSTLKERCETLIEKWHGAGRIRFALTPRFAPSSTNELMNLCQELYDKHQDIYLQTHINESKNEIAWMKELSPGTDYLGAYEAFRLVRERTILAHSIHPSDSECQRMGHANCAVAHCPSSNAFLGSGAFSFQKHLLHDIRVGLATDVGAGMSFSLWSEMTHAHLIQMRHEAEDRFILSGEQLLKLATVDGARVLSLENEVGNFAKGKWADFFKIDSKTSKEFLSNEEEASRKLFEMAFQEEKRRILETFIAGRSVFAQANKAII